MTGSPKVPGARICMLIWHFYPAVGGAEQQCLRLSKDLAKRGVPVMVVTKRLPGAPASEVLDGIEIHRVPSLSRLRARTQAAFGRGAGGVLSKVRNLLTERLPRYAFMAGAYWRMYRLRDRFDIVHVHEGHWAASVGARFAARNGKKSLVKEASSGAYLRLNFSTQLWPEQTRRADVFIAISRRIAADLREAGVDGERIRVIPNGVPLPERVWSGPAAGPPGVLFVGNLSQQPYKGIDVLLRAWSLIGPWRAKASLHLLGGGDGAALRALCGELGIGGEVEFHGAVKNVEEHMLRSALYVLPSRIEGMSNSLLEAMALGLPVISTRISGSEDLIEPGVNGLLAPPEDPEAMARAIVSMLEDPAVAAAMGRRARSTIEGGYTIRAVAGRYQELYHSMLDRDGTGGKREHAR
jgi:glycosyltransferase involved in cell wall biosynthesis